jgi:hypothetical protein
MAICGCGLPAWCCQLAVAGRVIYADLRGELNTHLALQALFTQSSPVREPLLQAFPFPSTLEEVTLHPLSQSVCLFTVHMRSGLPPSPVVFSSLYHSHKLFRSWLLGVCPCSCPFWPGPACLFTVLGGIPLPTLGAQGTPPSCVFIVLIAYYSVSLFSLGGGWSVHGALLIWPRIVCGSTAYCLAHLVHVFRSHLGAGVWRPGGPPGFSVQHEVEILCAGWRCGGVKFCLFSVALPARCVSSFSPRFHHRRHAFCFLPLAAILESSMTWNFYVLNYSLDIIIFS